MGWAPENGLEAAIVDSTGDDASTERFRWALHDAELLVPQTKPAADDETVGLLREGDAVELPLFRRDDKWFVTVFSSVTQLLLFAPEGTPYLALRGRDLARIWDPDHWMVLNPTGDLGLELPPEAVIGLLEREAPGSVHLPAGTEVKIGRPAEVPEGLEAALSDHMVVRPSIAAAWVALLQVGDDEDDRQLVVVVETDGSGGHALGDDLAGFVPPEALSHMALAAIALDRSDPHPVALSVADNATPFYRRA